MSVAIVIPDGFEAAPLIGYAARFARAKETDLWVLGVSQARAEPSGEMAQRVAAEKRDALESVTQTAVNEELVRRQATHVGEPVDADDPQPGPKALEFAVEFSQATDPAYAVLDKISEAKIDLLVLPRHAGVKSTAAEFALQRTLYGEALCTAMQLCLGSRLEDCRKILVPSRGSQNTAVALRLATDLAETNDGSVTALHVVDDFDPDAQRVGARIIGRLIERYADDQEQRVRPQAMVHQDVVEAICTVSQEDFDLVLLGASYHSIVHRMLFSSINEEILSQPLEATVGIVRPPIPIESRVVRAMERGVSDVVPQLDRQQRVELVERIHASSQWNFDFIALISLSTLIATLGLLQDSGAVVIGAMLVAPLMTPLLGAGLSLVQGNKRLVLSAGSSVAQGFVVALLIAWVTGMMGRAEGPTAQMLARGSPGVSDLLIAFASGLAAAYAIGRPHLISALPGVAIAAALVPPIATAGLAAAMDRWELAAGALLLFFTNIVAIVLGAAGSLWLVGIRGAHAHGYFAPWARRLTLALALIAAGLGVYELFPSAGVPKELRQAIEGRIAQEENVTFQSVALVEAAQGTELRIFVESPAPPSEALLQELTNLTRERLGPRHSVRLEGRLVRVASPSSETVP